MPLTVYPCRICQGPCPVVRTEFDGNDQTRVYRCAVHGEFREESFAAKHRQRMERIRLLLRRAKERLAKRLPRERSETIH